MEWRTYGLRGFGFLVFWLSVVCVHVVCVGVAFCKFEVCFVSCFVYLEFGVLGCLISWVPVMLFVCNLYIVCLNIVSWLVEA